MLNGVPKGSRTPVNDVRGRCPRPLDDGNLDHILFHPYELSVWALLKGVNR